MQRVTRDQLREHLDEYVDAAAMGETIEIGDNGDCVASLVPPQQVSLSPEARRRRLARSIDEAQKILASVPRDGIDVVALLREDRDAR